MLRSTGNCSSSITEIGVLFPFMDYRRGYVSCDYPYRSYLVPEAIFGLLLSWFPHLIFTSVCPIIRNWM